MPRCPTCGVRLSEIYDDEYCPNCGNPLENKGSLKEGRIAVKKKILSSSYCPNCGIAVDTYKFCDNCGTELTLPSPNIQEQVNNTVKTEPREASEKIKGRWEIKQSRAAISTASGWKSGLAVIGYGLLSFPVAGLAWVLMWVTDRLYEGGWWWWIAVPIRIITFLMQLGVFMGCLAIVVGIVWIMTSIFYRASRGQDSDGKSRLSVKGYMLFLLLPVAMGVVSLLVTLFNNWLNFNEHGLGLIFLGYVALNWVLEIGSLVIILVWLVIFPIILLRKRNA